MTGQRETGETLQAWFAAQLPEELFEEAPEITVDREEISVVGRIPEPPDPSGPGEVRTEAVAEQIAAFRERTRGERIEIARRAEYRYGRKVSWGVECAGRRAMFTTLSVPAMTRLRQPERQILDTLVAGGVARSRSEALAWCVQQVGKNADGWLGELREALHQVREVREQGPDDGARTTTADTPADSPGDTPADGPGEDAGEV